jgi:hypothetical protein
VYWPKGTSFKLYSHKLCSRDFWSAPSELGGVSEGLVGLFWITYPVYIGARLRLAYPGRRSPMSKRAALIGPIVEGFIP